MVAVASLLPVLPRLTSLALAEPALLLLPALALLILPIADAISLVDIVLELLLMATWLVADVNLASLLALLHRLRAAPLLVLQAAAPVHAHLISANVDPKITMR
jgi:hypothetical protein